MLDPIASLEVYDSVLTDDEVMAAKLNIVGTLFSASQEKNYQKM